jgi:hypothetical protein
MKIAIPDLVSNSYFPAIAAVDLGFFKEEGLDMELELIFPVDHTLEKMRDGEIDFVGGSAHSTPHAFPGWKGGKLLGALAQGMYWFLILRSDLGAKQGDIEAVKGLNIGAAPLVDLGLMHLLTEYGINLEKDKVNIAPVPGAFTGKNVNFGVTAAKALQDGKIDGFWANGMGAEVAVKSGAGTLVIDARRGDGPASDLTATSAPIPFAQNPSIFPSCKAFAAVTPKLTFLPVKAPGTGAILTLSFSRLIPYSVRRCMSPRSTRGAAPIFKPLTASISPCFAPKSLRNIKNQYIPCANAPSNLPPFQPGNA